MNTILDKDFVKTNNTYKTKTLTTIIWATILLIGIIFRIIDWPGYNTLQIIGASGLIAYNLSGFIRLKGKNMLNNIMSLLSIVWIIYIISGIFFNDGHPLNFYGLIMHFTIFIIFLLFTNY